MRVLSVSNQKIVNFQSSNNGLNWSWRKLKILKKDDFQMRSMAEYFHKMTIQELEQVVSNETRLFVTDDMSKTAFFKLSNAVSKVQEYKENIEKRLKSGNLDLMTKISLESELECLNNKSDNKDLIKALFCK